MRLFEWHSDSFLKYGKKIPGFVNYLAGIWQNRNRYVDQEDDLSEEEQQEQKIQKQRFFDFTIDGRISARNYVGVVQYEDIRVEVYPKIFADDPSGNIQQWQLNLLYWLSYCRKIKFPFSFADVSRLRFDDYLELLIYIFANYTEDVLTKQPFQAYQTVEEETAFLKGRLSFDNYTKHNLITGKWQHLYCNYEPLVYDNQFNRIVKYVSRRLLAISENHLNKEKLNNILFVLDDVSDIRCTASDCEKVQLNALYEDHKHVLSLCSLYLSDEVIDIDDNDNRNFCFLLPMEYVFEDFIYAFISDKWPWLNVKGQSTDYLALNEAVPVFQIRNDIYINNRLIIDTKYKIRSLGDGLKAGVSQSDLYQMVSYALKRNCTNVLLLYPAIPGRLNTGTVFNVPSLMLPADIDIHVRNLDITFSDIQQADAVIRSRIQELHPVFR